MLSDVTPGQSCIVDNWRGTVLEVLSDEGYGELVIVRLDIGETGIFFMDDVLPVYVYGKDVTEFLREDEDEDE